jgi:hypothetical protein
MDDTLNVSPFDVIVNNSPVLAGIINDAIAAQTNLNNTQVQTLTDSLTTANALIQSLTDVLNDANTRQLSDENAINMLIFS